MASFQKCKLRLRHPLFEILYNSLVDLPAHSYIFSYPGRIRERQVPWKGKWLSGKCRSEKCQKASVGTLLVHGTNLNAISLSKHPNYTHACCLVFCDGRAHFGFVRNMAASR